MMRGGPFVIAVILAATSGCDLVAGPASAEEKQLLRAALVQVAEQASMIDKPACVDRSTTTNRDHIIYPEFWQPAQYSNPVWRAYAGARPPKQAVRMPPGSVKGVSVRSSILNDLFCGGWRVKLHTPVLSGRFGYVVIEDPVAFFIYAFAREKGGWRVIHFGARGKGSIVV